MSTALRSSLRQPRGELRFDAFVSYSHAVDGELAPGLQRGLHALGRPWYRLRALHIFRDSTSLSATPALWSSIVRAMEASRYFILLSSPEAAQSPWVAREVRWWREHRSPDTLLLAITDGEVLWRREGADFDWAVTTAVPRVLEGYFAEEPLWVDFRWVGREEQLSPRDPRFLDAVADLAAPLWGRPKDDLLGEDLRQHRRTMRLARTAASCLALLLVIASVAGVVAFQQRDEARAQRDVAVHQRRVATARQLLAQAESTRDDDPRTALLLGIAAHHFHEGGETRSGLVRTLSTNRYAGTLTGHRDSVDTLQFSRNGRLLVTGSTGEPPILWDVSDRMRPPQRGHRLADADSGDPSAFSPDGNTLVTADDDDRLMLWDVTEPSRPVLKGTSPKAGTGWLSLAFAPDGKTLAAGSADTVVIFEMTGQDRLTRVGRAQPARAPVAFAPDGRTLATGTAGGAVVLWDVSKPGQPVRAGEANAGYPDVVTGLAFAPNGATLATSGFFEDDVTLWDVSDRHRPTRLGQPLTGHEDTVYHVAFSPDGETLASGSGDNTTILWDVSDPREPSRREVLGGHTELVGAVAFAPDGKALATASADRTVILWDLWGRGRPTRVGETLSSIIAEGQFNSVDSMAWAPRGRMLAVANTTRRAPDARSEHIVTLVNVSDGSHPVRLGSPLTGHSKPVTTIAFSPEGGIMATASSDKAILWHVADPARPARQAELPGQGTTALAFAPDGRSLATGQEGSDAYLWDISDPGRPRRLERPLSGHSEGIAAIAFARDGRTVATGSVDNTARLWDVSEPSRPARLGEALTGHTNGVNAVAFSSDMRTLVTAGSDSKVMLWDVSQPGRAFRFGRPLETHAFLVFNPAVFVPGRHALLTGGQDGTETLLWDVSDPVRPVQLWRLTGHRFFVTALAIAPEADLLATGDLEGKVVAWDLTDFNALYDDALRRACDVTGRGLDREEWMRYLQGVPFRQTCPG